MTITVFFVTLPWKNPLSTSSWLVLQLSFFMEIIVTVCWSIWTVRNDVIFQQVLPSVDHCKTVFRTEFAQVILRAKGKPYTFVSQWLEAYV